MQNLTVEVAKRATFGRRRMVPRAIVVESKKHSRAFLVETLDELGFVAGETPAEPAAIMAVAPDLVVLGISGNDGLEISKTLRILAEARFAGSVLNVCLDRFQETTPPLNRCVITSPFSVWSAIGAPSEPVAPPSLSHAAFIAPRTMTAP